MESLNRSSYTETPLRRFAQGGYKTEGYISIRERAGMYTNQ